MSMKVIFQLLSGVIKELLVFCQTPTNPEDVTAVKIRSKNGS